MAKIDQKRFLERTLSYLGDPKQEGALALSDEIMGCLAELEEEAEFRGCYERYPIDFDEGGYPGIGELGLSFHSEDLKRLFAGRTEVLVIASTLGVAYERYSKRVQSHNLSHAVVLDAASSAYLEGMTDLFEEELGLGERTFRFAPGYGDLDLALNAPLMRGIRADKRIGLTVGPSGLFLPQKSMLGLIGLGGETGLSGASAGAKEPGAGDFCAGGARRGACGKGGGSAKCFLPG